MIEDSLKLEETLGRILIALVLFFGIFDAFGNSLLALFRDGSFTDAPVPPRLTLPGTVRGIIIDLFRQNGICF